MNASMAGAAATGSPALLGTGVNRLLCTPYCSGTGVRCSPGRIGLAVPVLLGTGHQCLLSNSVLVRRLGSMPCSGAATLKHRAPVGGVMSCVPSWAAKSGRRVPRLRTLNPKGLFQCQDAPRHPAGLASCRWLGSASGSAAGLSALAIVLKMEVVTGFWFCGESQVLIFDMAFCICTAFRPRLRSRIDPRICKRSRILRPHWS